MQEVQIDAEELINMVHERPVIWDRRLDIHKDRSLTKFAWEEICIHFTEEYDEMSDRDKRDTVRTVMSKWNNIRDNWIRCQKRWKEESEFGVKSKTRRKYIHHDQLLFLEKAIERRERESARIPASPSCETSDEDKGGKGTKEVFRMRWCSPLPPRRPGGPIETPEDNATTKWKTRNEFTPSASNASEHHRHQRDESNLSFFLSVMPMIDDFKEDETLEFRMGVLQSISSVKKRRRSLGDLRDRSQFAVQQEPQFPALPYAFPHPQQSQPRPLSPSPGTSNVRTSDVRRETPRHL